MSDKLNISHTMRFAPSPTGFLHLGHAYSAYLNKKAAILTGGLYRLRIEDIDFTRCTATFYKAIMEDLAWLGLLPDDVDSAPPLRQALRRPLYREKINWLVKEGLAYPCFCTRAKMKAKGDRYTGTCRPLTATEQQTRIDEGTPFAMRLNQQAVHARFPAWANWTKELEDIIIARKDIGVAYVIAVVVDDAREGISHIIRGNDLENEAIYQEELHMIFGSHQPRVFHHSLIVDDQGERLAKSKGSPSLRSLREAGIQPRDLLNQLAEKAAVSGDLENLHQFLGL